MASCSLLNDIIFKIVFGTEANRPVLRALLNALLGLTGSDRISELTILNPWIGKDYLADKDAILDVKAQDARGRLYNIEVQLTFHRSYVERAVYYLARLYVGQLEKGDPYTQLARTIGISLVDFVLIPNLDDLHSRYRLHDEAHARELSTEHRRDARGIPRRVRRVAREGGGHGGYTLAGVDTSATIYDAPAVASQQAPRTWWTPKR